MSFADMHSEFLLMKQIEQNVIPVQRYNLFYPHLAWCNVQHNSHVDVKKSMYFVASSLNVFYTTKIM